MRNRIKPENIEGNFKKLCECGKCDIMIWHIDDHYRIKNFEHGHNGVFNTVKEYRKCEACDTDTTVKNTWCKHDGHWLCGNCYTRYVRNPAFSKQYAMKNNPRRVRFGNKRVIIIKTIDLKSPRKGTCQICGKVGRTNIHHKQYHNEDPLKDTIELCVSCHTKESWKLGQITKQMVGAKKKGLLLYDGGNST